MDKKIAIAVLALLALTVFVSGCSQQPVIKSTEEAVNQTGNIAEKVDDIASKLDKITETLGGS